MTTTNDITGDKLKTKPANNQYRDNYEAIFRKKDKDMKVTSNKVTDNQWPDGSDVIGGGTSNSEADGL